MKKEDFHKYLYAGITGFLVIVCSILFFYVLYNTKNIGDIFDKLFGILMPFIIGGVIAYLLTPVSNWMSKYVMRFLIRILGGWYEDIVIRQKEDDAVSDEDMENAAEEEAEKQEPETIIIKVKKWFPSKKKKEREYVLRRRKYKKLEGMADGISIISSLLLVLVIIYTLFALVIPELIVSMTGLVEVFPSSVSDLKKLILGEFEGNEMIYGYLVQFMDTLNDNIESFLTKFLLPNMQSLMTTIYSSIFSAIGVVKNILIGIIVSVYLMARRKQFLAQSILLLRSVFNEKTADAILGELDIANRIFGGFIRGKLVDSLLIGILCFIVMSVFQMPYALLISTMIGVTNIIPFFGPFIGAVPSAFLVLIADSGRINFAGCIYFLIFILILQQFDGNILGPMILGDSTGLSSFWVLFSILLFGGLFGIVGMVIGVPLFAVIYDLVKKFVQKSLVQKGKSAEMEKYERRFHSGE